MLASAIGWLPTGHRQCSRPAATSIRLVSLFILVASIASLAISLPSPPTPTTNHSTIYPTARWSHRRLLQHHNHRNPNSEQTQFNSRLSINVRNNGGEVFRQTISANVKQNLVQIDFQETDGSFITQLVDFANNIQLFRVSRLGEQDLNEQKVQVFCFVSRLPADQFISSEAISNLRQKSPSSIRHAEEDRGSETQSMDLEIVPEYSDLISPHIDRLCGSSLKQQQQQVQQPQRIYASQADLSLWATPSGHRNYSNIGSAIRKISLSPVAPSSSHRSPQRNNSSSNNSPASNPSLSPARCGEILAAIYQNVSKQSSPVVPLASQFPRAPCHCSLPVCIAWYPCDLKYCPNGERDPSSDADTYSDPDHPNSYRCGIKTCRKRYEFRFEVSDKLFCLANFDFDSDQHSRSTNSTPILVPNDDPSANRDKALDDELDPKPKQAAPLSL